MSSARVIVLSLLILLMPPAYSAVSKQVVDIPTRPGVTVRMLYNAPDSPIAHLILFTGNLGPDDGVVGIQPDGSLAYAQPGFDARILGWLAAGISFTVIDPPSDRLSLDPLFRRSSEHAADIAAITRYLQLRASVPVWLMGLGSGAISVASVASRLGRSVPLGVIIGNPHTVGGNALTTADLTLIYGPTLVINHSADACPCCPPASVGPLVGALVNAAAVEHVALVGGDGPADPCNDVVGPHGWGGLSDLVIDTITGWIKEHNALLENRNYRDINEHGLTGSWYEPTTNGQGVEIEIYPNVAGPSTAAVQVSWFTYDAVVGVPEHQRWYTLGGNVAGGDATATLAIYQNVGGNFNAAPITNATQVGSATLRFADCDHGTLDYAFNDSSGRSGSIELTRLAKNVTCGANGTGAANADFAFSGNWYDPETSGQGITVEINPLSPVAFFAWYTYALTGAAAGASGQRWFTGQSSYAAGARTLGMTLYETTGGRFDTPTTPPPTTRVVGTATLDFQSCSAATLDYMFTSGSSVGAANKIALRRVGPVPPGCAM